MPPGGVFEPASQRIAMPPISVSIVCKNSKATLPRVLEAVRPIVADGGELVVVDTGSTDGTVELLESFGARVVKAPWQGFARTKQQGMELCERPWILCLDSDEPPEADLVRSIVDAVGRDDPAIGGYRVNRKLFFAGRYLEHCWQPEWRLRLVRRGSAVWGGLEPHAKLELISGAQQRDLPGTLRHDSFVSFAQHLERQATYARVAGVALFDRGERSGAVQVCTTAPLAFLKQVVIKSAWRDGWRGILAAASTAAGTLMKHIVLAELTMREREEHADIPDATRTRA